MRRGRGDNEGGPGDRQPVTPELGATSLVIVEDLIEREVD